MVTGKGSENKDEGNNVALKRPRLQCQNLLVALVAPQSEGHQAMSVEWSQSLPEMFEVLEARG